MTNKNQQLVKRHEAFVQQRGAAQATAEIRSTWNGRGVGVGWRGSNERIGIIAAWSGSRSCIIHLTRSHRGRRIQLKEATFSMRQRVRLEAVDVVSTFQCLLVVGEDLLRS